MKSHSRRWLNLTALENRLAPATITWHGGATPPPGNTDTYYGVRWTNPANWYGGIVPGTDDTALFDPASTTYNGFGQTVRCMVDAPVTVVGIMIVPPPPGIAVDTVDIPNTLTTTGASTLNSGVITGGGTWDNQGTVSLNSATDNVNFRWVTVNNSGSFVHNSAKNLNLETPFDGGGYPVLNNLAGAVFEFQNDGDVAGTPAPGNYFGTFNNGGLVRKTGGAGNSFITGQVNSQNGAWDLLTGSMTLGPTTTSTLTGGTFKVATGTALDVVGYSGAATWTGNFTATGPGLVMQSSGKLTIGALGATFDLPNFELQNGAIAGSGKLDFSGSMALTGTSGSLNGADFHNFGTIIHKTTNTFTLSAGAVLTNEASGIIDFQTDGDIFESATNAGAINNKGLIKKTGGGAEYTYVRAIINNLGGTWDAKAGNLIMSPYGGGTNTGGTFNASAGAYVSLLDTATATFTGTYTGSGAGQVAMSSGNLIVGAAGATFNFPAGMLNWYGGSIKGGTLTNAGFITISPDGVNTTPTIDGATLSNTGTITHLTTRTLAIANGGVLNNEAAGVYDFQSDGDIFEGASNSGTLNNKGLIEKTGGAGVSYVRGIVNNQGGTWDSKSAGGNLVMSSNGTHTGGTFNASAGASLSLTDDRNATWTGDYSGSGAGNVYLSNGTMSLGAAGANFNFPAGLFNWYGGTVNGSGTMTNSGNISLLPDGVSPALSLSVLTLSNAGTIVHTNNRSLNLVNGAKLINEVNGVFDYQADGAINATGGSMNNKGLFKKSAGTGQSGFFSGPLTNSGTIDVQTGTIYVNATASITLSGLLKGNGSFGGPVIVNSSGQVSPGASPGLLNISGYQQSGTGDLRIEIAGTTAGTTYDQLAVFGAVSLGGTLHVALGYVPAVNDTFTIINNDTASDKVTGEFDNLTQGGTITVNGVAMQIDYKGGDGNDVTLKVTQAATVAPPTVAIQVNDGSAQRSMVTSIRATFSESVVFIGNPFTLTRTGPGGPTGNVNVNVDLTQSTANQTIAVLTFNGGLTNFKSLRDGRYTLNIAAPAVTGLGGQLDGDGNGTGGDSYTEVGTPGVGNNLFRLFGDANGDGTVNGTDFLAFRIAFLGTNPAFDFDGDGQVSGADFLAFRIRFLQSV